MSLLRVLGTSVAVFALVGTAACSASSEDPKGPEAAENTGGYEQDLRGVKKCGGLTGQFCTGNLTCVDDPIDTCDPNNGGVDCVGMCINVTKAAPCGGVAGIQCGDGYRCVDDPTDECVPGRAVDCSGICVKAACDAKLASTVTCNDGWTFDPTKCACKQLDLACAALRCASGFHCEANEAGPLCVVNAY